MDLVVDDLHISSLARSDFCSLVMIGVKREESSKHERSTSHVAYT
jgi:hypothetical protein